MKPRKQIKAWLRIAEEAALKAGRSLLRAGKSAREIRADSLRDIKIKADVYSERIIVGHLKKHSDFSILCEESGLLERDKRNFTWIVDPLDGSLNYMRGIPLCSVSIGLWQEAKPILGVVYEFTRAELFSGIAKNGAWLNKHPLKTSNIIHRYKAVLGTGFPVNTDFTSAGVNKFVDRVRSYKKIRMFGSAALSIAYVASGRIDTYQENDIMLWDIAGSIPVLLGAGGKVSIKKAAKPYSFNVFASNGRLNQKIMQAGKHK